MLLFAIWTYFLVCAAIAVLFSALYPRIVSPSTSKSPRSHVLLEFILNPPHHLDSHVEDFERFLVNNKASLTQYLAPNLDTDPRLYAHLGNISEFGVFFATVASIERGGVLTNLIENPNFENFVKAAMLGNHRTRISDLAECVIGNGNYGNFFPSFYARVSPSELHFLTVHCTGTSERDRKFLSYFFNSGPTSLKILRKARHVPMEVDPVLKGYCLVLLKAAFCENLISKFNNMDKIEHMKLKISNFRRNEHKIAYLLQSNEIENIKYLPYEVIYQVKPFVNENPEFRRRNEIILSFLSDPARAG